MRGYVSYLGITTSLFSSIIFSSFSQLSHFNERELLHDTSLLKVNTVNKHHDMPTVNSFLGLSLNGACDQWICRWIGFLPRFSFSSAASIHLHSSLFLALIAVELIEKLGRAQSHGKCFLIPKYLLIAVEKAKGKIGESGLSQTSFGPFLKKLSVDFLRPSEIPPCGLFSTSNDMPRLKSILLVHSQLFALLGKGITSTQPNILRNFISFHLLAGLSRWYTLTQGISLTKCFPSCCENKLTLVRLKGRKNSPGNASG